MRTNQVFNNFASGELSPNVWGRSDRPFYVTGLEISRNFIPLVTGGLTFRPGLGYATHTRLNQKAYFVDFEFNTEQAYTLEFTAGKMRVYKNGAVVTETAKTITDITAANPGVLTSVGHGFSDGDEVYISGIVGTTELNGNFYLVDQLSADTFHLTDIDGNDIDTTAMGAYVSGGTAARVYEITSPYAEVHLPAVKYAQTADLAYLVHPYYPPYKLTRTGHAAWTLATYTRTADPFVASALNITGITQANPGVITIVGHGLSNGQRILIESVGGMTELNGNSYYVVYINTNTFSLTTLAGVAVNTTGFGAYTAGGTVKVENYPGAVGFYGGRLWMGGSDWDPDAIWGSMGPDATTGASRYDNFTVGTAALDALIYTVTPQTGSALRVRWFSATPRFMVIGTYDGVYKANGGTDGSAITPTAIDVKPMTAAGVADTMPVFVNNITAFIQLGGRTVRTFEFDFLSDDYTAFDRNTLADEISGLGITKIALTRGRPDILWGVRSDGVLLSCTLLSKEEIAGWTRHYIGGTDAVVIDISAEAQTDGTDKLVICVERTIDGHTRRYVEYMTIDPIVPDPTDYFSNEDSEDDDTQQYRALVFEEQKKFNRLDSSLVLDQTQTIALTLGAVSGTSVTCTAGSTLFAATDVGRYIFMKYLTGLETGVAKITGYTSGTVVTVNILQTFSSVTIAANNWYLTATAVRGLSHLEGETVGVITDGGVHPNEVVADGAITLDYPARYVIVGLKYKGFIRMTEFDFGAEVGSAQQRPKNICKLGLKVRNTMGGKFGSSLYRLSEIGYRMSGVDYTDRPPLLKNGWISGLKVKDMWSDDKRLYIVQDSALPITILSIVPDLDVTME